MGALYGFLLGIILSGISFVISLITAVISSASRARLVWVFASYAQSCVLLVFLLMHYFDGAHYLGPIKRLVDMGSLIILITIVPFFIHLNVFKRWNIPMWIFSFVIPIFVLCFGFDLGCDQRPMSQDEMESILSVELPRYKVVEYEEYSLGGDDWESNCQIIFLGTNGLESFISELNKKCFEEQYRTNYGDELREWSKTDTGFSFYDNSGENYIWFTIDINNRTLSYRSLKI